MIVVALATSCVVYESVRRVLRSIENGMRATTTWKTATRTTATGQLPPGQLPPRKIAT